MNKFSLALLLLCIAAPYTFSQSTTMDSLRQIVETGRRDSITCRAILQLGINFYNQSNFDRAMLHGQQAAVMAAAANWTRIESASQNLIGNIYMWTGAYDKALEAYLISLKTTEKTDNEVEYGKMLSNIGGVYAGLGDYSKSNEYTYQAKTIAEKRPTLEPLAVSLLNLGDNYYRLGVYDSAKAFAERAYSVSRRYNHRLTESLALGNLGNAYAATGAFALGLDYYRKALMGIGDQPWKVEILLGMAGIFRKTDRSDSALYYARASFHGAIARKMTAEALAASQFLTEFYRHRGQVDSAYRYLNHVVAAKDSLFSQEKTRQIQALSFEETARQQKLQQAKLEAEEARSRNIQYSIMAVGIVCFLMLILLLSRSVILNEKWIRFLGMLGLLLLFEFINLFMDPLLGSITHQSPFLIYIALVVLAAILVPVHAKIEHYVLAKLTQKNRHLKRMTTQLKVSEVERQDVV